MVDRRESFDAIFRRCERPVLGYALRRAPAEVARDAVADAFVAAWRRFDELPQDPLPWLIAATRKALANQRRGSVRQARLAERLARECPAEGVVFDAPVADAVVARALRTLSPADREVLALVAWDGLTAAQAACSLDCTPVAFRVRLHRARRRLAHALEQESEQRVERDPLPTAKEAS